MMIVHQIALLFLFCLSYNNFILASNKKSNKLRISPTGTPKIVPHKIDNDEQWLPITYKTETNHNINGNFEESNIKDISGKSSEFFHDITGTESPYEKDLKTLSDRGLKVIKDEDRDNNYKNLDKIESKNGAALSLRIPNKNFFNRPVSYGFVIPSTEDEQNTEQANHHNNYHQYHHHSPHQHNIDHHHRTTENPYTNFNHNANQDIYYQKQNQFSPHFEGLTQSKDFATPTNYHNSNQRKQNLPTESSVNYDIGIQHTMQDPSTHFPSAIQHYNDNSDKVSSTNSPHHQEQIQQYSGHPSGSYNHQQLYFDDENKMSPHFEALTAEKSSNHNGSTRKNKHYEHNSNNEHNCDNNRENTDCTEQKKIHHSRHIRPHKNRKHHHNRHHHENPDTVLLLNHKIYHDDDETSSSPEDSSQHSHQTKHSNKFQKSKKSKKPKRHYKRNHNRQLISQHQPKHLNEQYQISEHPHKGQSYQVIEYPQESKISETILLPLNKTINNFDNSNSKKIETIKSINEVNGKTVSKQKHRQPLKNNKIKLKLYENNSKLTKTTTSSNYPKPEYKFLINYQDEQDKGNSNINGTESVKSPITNKDIQFFQDIYLAKNEPQYIELGHKLQNPGYLEERFEEHDHGNHNYRGSVKWVKDNGEQGQQIWNLGHLG